MHCHHESHQDISNQIADLLKGRNQTIAVAESVTAGQLQTSLSIAERALDFFQGGVTAYNLGQKTKLLGIDPILAMDTDCVSQQIAITMAKNVARLFNCNWGIGITGYASPVPEKNIEELFACFAITCDDNTLVYETVTAEKQDPFLVRQFYTRYVLEQLLSLLRGDIN